MNFKNYFSFILFMALVTACSIAPEDDPNTEEPPTATTLLFPENNTECNEGTILNDSLSSVVFLWNTSANTDSYEVVLTKTDTEETTNFETDSIFKEITLERGVTYKWFVISKSEETEETATSENFQFFNAAAGVVNYVPFSAEAIAPKNDSEITQTDEKVNLQWITTDLDYDITAYEVFFGPNKDELESLGLQSTTSLEVNVNSDTTYFWSVKTIDEANNSSESDIFSFTVL